MVPWGLLRDPLGGNEGTRGVKIGITNKRKSNPALERGRTKLTEQYQVLRGTGNLTRKMRSWSGYADW